MNSSIICKYCRKPNHSLNYNCNCQTPQWTNKYRTLDLKIRSDEVKKLASESFFEYSFLHPQGMLQHKTLPYNHNVANEYPTVGLTPLYNLDRLSQHYGAEIFLKDEGKNPSGCFKDRETMLCLLNSKHHNLLKATIFSSGNAAASAAFLANHSGHKLITFVSGDTYLEKINYIRSYGADVIVIGDSQSNFEQGYELFSTLNAQDIFTENGYDNWSVCNPYRIEADKTISLEIIKQLSVGKKRIIVPDYVIVPTANGSCLTGIWKGFKELEKAGVILRLPKMVSAGIKHANPVAKAVETEITERPVSCDLSKLESKDAQVGSVIVAEEGYDSMEASKAILESSGCALEFQRSDIQHALTQFLEIEEEKALEHSILPEPAALTSLAAINKLKRETGISSSDRVVTIATGDGLKAENMLFSLLSKSPVSHQKVIHILNNKKKRKNKIRSSKGKRINTEENVEALTEAFSQLQSQFVNA